MKIKVFRSLVTLTLVFLLAVTSFPAFAGTYSPGPRDYELDRSLMLKANKVSISGDTLNFAAGGKVTFDLLLPFETDKLELKYETLAKDVNLEVITNENSYKAVLKKETKETAVSIEKLSGSHTITFEADRELTLKGINFHKVNENYYELNSSLAPFTDYDEAMLSLFALKCNIGVIKTRNNLLRWDAENIYISPKRINDSIYVPAKKFAEAIHLYCEDYKDLSYLYMLDETSSLSLKNGIGYFESTKDGKKAVEVNVHYEDGQTYVPVRQIAELFGHTVGYQDGLVLVGDRLRIKKVFENITFLKALDKEFEEYAIHEKRAEGKIYHVAQTAKANDANSGTEKYPFLTIQKAADVAKAGDTVIVHEGTYREIVKPKNSGTAMAPITFKAAKDEKVVISALEKLSGFIDYKDDILCVTAPNNLGDGRNQIFYKGEQLMAGRHPNSDTKPGVLPYPDMVPEGLYATRGNIMITDQPNGEIAYSDTDLNQEEKDYWKGALYVSLKGAGWAVVTGEVVSSEKGMLKLDDHEGTKAYNLGIRPAEGNTHRWYFQGVHDTDFAYLTNHINTVDIPGEWFMKNNTVYIIPPEGADLEKDFEIKQRQLCIDLRDKNFITFDGIDTIGGSMTASHARGCTLLNGEFRYVAHHTRQIDASRYSMYVDENPKSFESRRAGEAGFYFGGSYNALVNCKIDMSSAMGICLNEKYHYISNSVISNCSYSGGYPGNIEISVDGELTKKDPSALMGGHIITYNTLYNAGRHVYGITYDKHDDGTYIGVSPTEFAYNRCFNGSLMTRDTGIVYEYAHTAGTDVVRGSMHHNYIYNLGHWDKDTGSMAMLLYHDNHTVSRDTYSNIVYYQDPQRPVTPRMQIYVQTDSIIRTRNNSAIGLQPEGDAGFTPSSYPGGRMFGVGADHGELAKRYIENYEKHEDDSVMVRPYDIKTDNDAKSKTFYFKDVKLENGGIPKIYYYMTRKAGVSVEFDIALKVYDKNGELVQETKNSNNASSKRYYVEDIHKGLVILDPVKTGKYNVELEIKDLASDVYYIIPELADTNYDAQYTKEDEKAGVVKYEPTDSYFDEFSGRETFVFKDVEITNPDKKTLINLHGLRENKTTNEVKVYANVYDKNGELVSSMKFDNRFENATPQEYEVLNGSVVIPELEAGKYDIEIEFSDEHFHLIRIVPEEADPIYDCMFAYPEIIRAGSYDDWTRGEDYEFDVRNFANYKESMVANLTYHYASDTWDHTLYYKDREVSLSANMLRFTYGTADQYAGSTVNVYVNTLDSEPIATFKTEDTGWKATPYYIKLNKTLKPGTYTFIVEFDAEGQCATFYNFSFCNEKLDIDK